MTGAAETAFTFSVNDNQCVGIIHTPSSSQQPEYGVLILVGGPQYRVGPHRQYVHLARYLAAAGIPVMRFDFRGVGDSEGTYPGFENIKDDLEAAIKAFDTHTPGLKGIIPWGLCEGASSILLSLTDHSRVAGAVLLNPWVRTEAGLAKTHLKHYYGKRLFSRDLWQRIISGKADIWGSIKSVTNTLKNSLKATSKNTVTSAAPYPIRMAQGLERFRKPVLLVQSEHDFVAREFDDMIKSDPNWKTIFSDYIERYDLKNSDHTFSTEEWRQAVADKTANWVRRLGVQD